jgi:hypothetical protein
VLGHLKREVRGEAPPGAPDLWKRLADEGRLRSTILWLRTLADLNADALEMLNVDISQEREYLRALEQNAPLVAGRLRKRAGLLSR